MKLITALFTALALFVTALSAEAQLKICNQTDINMKVAVGQHRAEADNRVCTDGWQRLEARSCLTMITEPLEYRYYWLTTTPVKHKTRPAGTLQLCMSRHKLRVATCTFRKCHRWGLQAQTFARLDTGETGPAFTYTLVDPAQKAKRVSAHASFEIDLATDQCDTAQPPPLTLLRVCADWTRRYAASNYRVVPHSLTAKSVRHSTEPLPDKHCRLTGTTTCTFMVK